jgi:hypothetical protein
MDMIVIFNLFFLYCVFIFGKSLFPFTAEIIFLILVYVVLPHISINFLFMAYVDIYWLTRNPRPPLRRVNQHKMIPWIIILIIVVSCVCLIIIYVPIVFIYNPQTPKDFVILVRIWIILYIFTNGLIQPVPMLVFVSLTYRNIRNIRQQAVGVSFISEIK